MGRVFAWTLAGVLAAATAQAQPILIPLQPQNRSQPTDPSGPVVSAPPVAPPQAGPSLPSTTDMADGPRVNPSEETASQPAPR